MKGKTSLFFCAAITILTVLFSPQSVADLSDQQIARLGNDLTPLGGERAGNAEGTIPEWTGGILSSPEGYQIGEHHRDPFSEDPILFTIDSSNLENYRDNLTPGHQRMLESYSSFRMPVYPSRRSASAPERIYEATRLTAATARLADDGNGVADAAIGIPFPIPENGLEIIWNHLLRYRGDTINCEMGQAAVTAGGDFAIVKFLTQAEMRYWLPNMTADQLDNTMMYFKQKITSPARLAGDILLVHETMNQVAEARRAWTYNPGQRRVRRAPNVAYDNPGTTSDGLRTSDQFDMFNGAVDRYNWELVGKREMFVPYNSYKLHSGQLAFSDLLTPLHPNPDHLRYELHRVWIVEATLKEGASHLYPRRTFYVDEDSWQILLADSYDARGELWRVSEGHVINYYENPLIWSTLEVHIDLQARRYLALGLDNEFNMCTWDEKPESRDFSVAALRREGIR